MTIRPSLPVIGQNNHARILSRLAKIAFYSEPVGQVRMACAITLKKELISVGINQLKSHPLQKQYGKNDDSIFLHSEIDAIKKALKKIDDLSKCTMYICRIKYTDRFKKTIITGLAKPCSGCSNAISAFGIRKVYYTLDGEGYGKRHY